MDDPLTYFGWFCSYTRLRQQQQKSKNIEQIYWHILCLNVHTRYEKSAAARSTFGNPLLTKVQLLFPAQMDQ